MTQPILPKSRNTLNPYRITGGTCLALGAGLTAVAAMSMDGSGAVLPLIVSGLAALVSGAAVLMAANRIEQAEADRDDAEAIADSVTGYSGCSGCDWPDEDTVCAEMEAKLAHEDQMWAFYKETKR